LDADDPFDGVHIFLRQASLPPLQARFTDRGYLVCHRLSPLAIQRHVGLGRIKPGDLAGNRDHLNPVEQCIGSVVA
jgi:hypothetical protein